MLRNYFTVAFRNFWRHKAFSLISVLSLAIGISASLVIYLVVNYEFSFEKFQQDGERVYRIVTSHSVSGKIYNNTGVPAPMGNAIREEITGIDEVIPIRLWNEGTTVSLSSGKNGKPVAFRNQKKIAFADESYFKLMPYKWLAGTASSSLSQPYNVVLSEYAAASYFPGQQVEAIIGKELFFSDTIRTTVTGVVEDLDQHTDFTFNTFISTITLDGSSLQPYDWHEWGSITPTQQLFVKLLPGANVAQLPGQVNNLYKKYHDEGSGNNGKTEFMLQPLSDLHFNSEHDNFGQRVANKPALYGLLAIAVFLLILGCINFINLTTARASRRAKEIGIRKTMGSSKRQLLWQFLSETFLLTLAAMILSLIMLPLLLKAFDNFIPEGLGFASMFQPQVFLFLLLLLLVITILSGMYPAFVLSSFNPTVVLKGRAYTGAGKSGHGGLRKGLIVFQFVIAQVFIIATLLISKQIDYSLNKDLGFKKDAIVYFHTPYSDQDQPKRNILVNKLKAIPEISMVSLSNNPPSAKFNRSSTMKYRDEKNEIVLNVDVKFCDTGYLRLYNIKLLAGTNLSHSDTVNGILINETYARTIGIQQPENAVGKWIEWDNRKVPVMGVVGDFHQKSFHELIRPLAIASSANQQDFLNIALRPQDEEGLLWQHTLAKIEKAWKEIFVKDDFEFAFLDQTIAAYYKNEQDISRLLVWATGLSILISYLGMIGLVIYTTLQRRKEISVRKIVGASVTQIMLLLLQEFFKLIAIAAVIAIPISWWSANKWMQGFVYRTNMNWYIFLAGLAIIFVFTCITLGAQVFRAANANPVRNMINE